MSLISIKHDEFSQGEYALAKKTLDVEEARGLFLNTISSRISKVPNKAFEYLEFQAFAIKFLSFRDFLSQLLSVISLDINCPEALSGNIFVLFILNRF